MSYFTVNTLQNVKMSNFTQFILFNNQLIKHIKYVISKQNLIMQAIISEFYNKHHLSIKQITLVASKNREKNLLVNKI